ncbi:hypothetical protein E2320_010165, partial [Naja naja]
CRKLTFHIQLPYSFLHLPYVEAAVRYTSRKDYCGNCSWYYLNGSQEKVPMTTEAPRDEVKSLELLKSQPEKEKLRSA